MVGRPLHGHLAVQGHEDRVRIAAIPDLHGLVARVHAGQAGRHEAVRRQQGLELAVELLGDGGQGKPLAVML
jgi:hypothetical protein